jgi:transposase
MSDRKQAMHVVTKRKQVNGRVYTCHLLCTSYRDENGNPRKRTISNLSALPDEALEVIRQYLKGARPTLIDSQMSPRIIASPSHSQVMVVLEAMKRLEFPKLLDRTPSRERSLVLAMVANRIINPKSKLATVPWLGTNTLAEELGIEGADEDDLYDAMDWLFERKEAIEKRLVARHLHEGDSALYDLSSSYMEGSACPLANFGYSRDRKRGKVQINYGLLTDVEGRPLSVEVYPGNKSDSMTFAPMVEKIKYKYNLNKIIMVGDRSMLGTKNIEILKVMDGVDWITALKSVSIKKIVEDFKNNPLSFNETNIFELDAYEGYQGERLIFCRNPALAERRNKVRLDLLNATENILKPIKARVDAGRLIGEGPINLAIGRVIDKYHIKKHFILKVTDNTFNFTRNEESIGSEGRLDGIYVIRLSLKDNEIEADDAVRTYKKLTKVERAFRSIKNEDLHIRPICHYTENRVKAHIFIFLLSYYILWHIKEAWRPVIFADTEIEFKQNRDPVAPAKVSDSAKQKISSKKTDDNLDITSFRGLFDKFTTINRSTVVLDFLNFPPINYTVTTEMDPLLSKTFGLIEALKL